jgi:hypothetical protein
MIRYYNPLICALIPLIKEKLSDTLGFFVYTVKYMLAMRAEIIGYQRRL